jgi:hypothetical protein
VARGRRPFAERLRGNVRPYQSVSELTVSAASALSDHYAAHAQLFQSDTHAPCEVLENVIDRRRSAALKGAQKECRQSSSRVTSVPAIASLSHLAAPSTATRPKRVKHTQQRGIMGKFSQFPCSKSTKTSYSASMGVQFGFQHLRNAQKPRPGRRRPALRPPFDARIVCAKRG